MLSDRENYLRTARFQGPQWIPCQIHLPHALFAACGAEVEKVIARHPTLFPNFKLGKTDYDHYEFPVEERVGEMVDPWGCTWQMACNGVIGRVVGNPLADWSAFEGFKPPQPLPCSAQRDWGDWQGARNGVEYARGRGELVARGLYHGFFFMRLLYLRGFENLMFDLVEEPPQLRRLMEMVKAHCAGLVRNWLEMGIDVLHSGEDLGTQTASIVSPAMFARFVTPVYRELFAPARSAGVLVFLHSDGHVLELMDEFAAAGVDIINPQDLVNGIDNLARVAKGRFCIDLDIDRQRIVPFGTPREIRDLIEEEVRKLGSPAGGLMLKSSVYPPAPLENLEAVCSAMEEFRTYYWA